MKSQTRLDANESAFFARQLESIKARTYDTKYKNLKAMMLLPVSTEAASGSQFITYRSYTAVGVAKIISDYANDFPRVDVYGEEKMAKVRGIGDSYGYSIVEIRRSMLAGTNLEQRRATAARRAIEEKIDSIAWLGDAAYGLQGFVNYPGISEYVTPVGVSTLKAWLSKTSDEIVKDITGLVNAVMDATNGREVPDTLILPIKQYLHIANTRMEGNSDKTILRYVLENNPMIKTIEWVDVLKGAGDGSTDRAMVYMRNPENLTLEIPQPFEQFPAEQEGMEFEIACHAECGGVIVYYPLSVAYADDI